MWWWWSLTLWVRYYHMKPRHGGATSNGEDHQVSEGLPRIFAKANEIAADRLTLGG